MILPREQSVTLTIAVVAILCVIGGFVSFNGLATYEQPVKINLEKSTFSQGDIFDAPVTIDMITLFSDETAMIYLDGEPVGAVILRKHMDDNRYDYGVEKKLAGGTEMEVISTIQPILLNLADYISLETLAPGRHVVQVSLSRGQVGTTAEFEIE